ncbi:MAG TPA: metallophosphoesterase family protein [Bradyrhizobium sp.]|uniref:metallophosphoesterase family protein n=1 Tax=Bradyrhizobium sp. TaxID=376 RepID=UPI002C4EBF88|nr:metallophosphoesterase family protein [Bradyrhizobium sp.]HLZ01619.1 metallophosphoesterase family protein [Bradyrhizobium sp.]
MMRARSAASSNPIAASTPPDTRLYAIGDIHGCADLLIETIERIERDLERRPIRSSVEIYLGDYVDRGPDAKAVIDVLAARLVEGRAVCLRGNHEDLMERFLRDPIHLEAWLQLGGLQTLASYGVTPRTDRVESDKTLHRRFCEAFPRAHELFLQCLKPWCACGDYLFVHAGIRPGIPLEAQKLGDLLWIRDEFLTSQRDHGKLIVHGHSPVPHPDIHHNRINIDTGACWTGTLTCLALEGTSILFL